MPARHGRSHCSIPLVAPCRSACGCSSISWSSRSRARLRSEADFPVSYHPPAVLARFEKLKSGDAALSVVTYGELLYGAQKSQQRDIALSRLADLVSILPVLEMPPEAADEYGEIRAALEKQGEMIGGNDLWIAAHAKAAGLVLVTNNEREFKRVRGLNVQNWVH